MGDWTRKRTEQTDRIVALLSPEFHQGDAYRFNSASIRVRVIDPKFEGMPVEDREDLIITWLDKLDPDTRSDVLFLLPLAPSEVGKGIFNRHTLMNLEFEDPPLSRL